MEYQFSSDNAKKVLKGLGGKDNIKFMDNCLTRLRVVLKDSTLIDKQVLVSTGATKVEQKNDETHVVYGVRILEVRKVIDEVIKFSENSDDSSNGRKILEYIGGKENIQEIDSCITRLRLILKDPSKLQEDKLKETGATKIIQDANNVHIVYGVKVDEIRKTVDLEINA